MLATPIAYRSIQNDEAWLVRRLSNGDPTILTGPTGCGKTTLVHSAAATLERRVVTVIGSRHLAIGDLVGRWHLGAEGSIWRDGPLTRAVREGAIFYLDEIEGTSEDILLQLNALLDHRRTLHITARDESLVAPPSFAFVGSYNPGYSRQREPLSPSFRQRCHFRALNYLPPSEEATLLSDLTGLNLDDATRLVEVAGVTRNYDGLAEGAGTRVLIAAAHDLQAGTPLDEVIEATIVLPLTDDRWVQSNLIDIIRTFAALDRDFESVPDDGPSEHQYDLDDDIFDPDGHRGADHVPSVQSTFKSNEEEP